MIEKFRLKSGLRSLGNLAKGLQPVIWGTVMLSVAKHLAGGSFVAALLWMTGDSLL